MGQLIDGVWHDTWYDTKSTGENFNALHQLSVTGSLRIAHPVQRAKGVSPPKKTAIISTFLWPVRGRIAR